VKMPARTRLVNIPQKQRNTPVQCSSRKSVTFRTSQTPRVKLNISSSTSSAGVGGAKKVSEVLEMLDEEASTYPSERVRVLGSLVNVKPHSLMDGSTSFTVISRSSSNKGLPMWKVILVFKDANDNSKNSRTIDVIGWDFKEF